MTKVCKPCGAILLTKIYLTIELWIITKVYKPCGAILMTLVTHFNSKSILKYILQYVEYHCGHVKTHNCYIYHHTSHHLGVSLQTVH